MPATLELFKRFNHNKVFIETGSFAGDGIQLAIEAGYMVIHSIEVSSHFAFHCRKRFRDKTIVTIWEGDSADVLPEVLNYFPGETNTIWLDGHYSGGDMPQGKHLSPLLQELEAIAAHPIKTHTILIDDINCWKEMDNHLHEGFNVETLIEKIKMINPEYKITIEDGQQVSGEKIPNDILIATI